MKRFGIFLLVIICCASIAGCAVLYLQIQKNNKYHNLILYLQQGDYGSAYSEISRLQSIYGTQIQADEDNTNVNETMLYGDWKSKYGDSESNIVSTVRFETQGKCVVDGELLSYVVTEYAKDGRVVNGQGVYTLRLKTSDSTKGAYYMEAWFDENGRKLMYIENLSNNAVGELVNMTDYEYVEISIDNFATYFDFIEYPNFHINGFNESENLTLDYSYILKPEYYSRINRNYTNVLIEYTGLSVNCPGSVDLENLYYEIDKNDYEEDEFDSNIKTTAQAEYLDNVADIGQGYAIKINESTYNDYTERFYTVRDITITKAQGMLCLAKA